MHRELKYEFGIAKNYRVPDSTRDSSHASAYGVAFDSLNFPLNLLQISIWLAFLSMMLFLTIEIVSYFGAPTGLIIDKSRLRLLLATVVIFFLVIIILRIYGILE